MNYRTLLRATDWEKRWQASDFSLVSCSLAGEAYDRDARRRFGTGLSRSFFVYRDRAVTCYQSASETERFGKSIARRLARNQRFAVDLCGEVTSRTKLLRKTMQGGPLALLQTARYREFVGQYRLFLPIFIALSRSANYVSSPATVRRLERARIYSENVLVEADAVLVGLVRALARRDGVGVAGLENLVTERELSYWLSTGKRPTGATLRGRRLKTALYSASGKSTFVSATNASSFERGLVHSVGKTAARVRGTSAYPGVVRGTVQIVFNPKLAKDFQKGSILVTGMTRPDFVPLMRKAGAVVTDAGGVLCHAAIVCRELKKPCVTGTKAATSVFKNGDAVTVNATEGLVERVSVSHGRLRP